MITSLYQSLCNMETNIADRVALRWYDEEKQGVAEVHYAQYAQDLRRFVAFLRAEYGDVRGKRVAILARNSYQYVICMYGTVIAGAVAVPLNLGKDWDAISYELGLTEPVCILQDGEFAEREPALTETYGSILKPMDAFSAYEPAEDVTEVEDLSALAFIMFTSGTTGRSKGVMLSEKNYFSAVRMYVAGQAAVMRKAQELAPKDMDKPFSHFTLVPMFHLSGFICYFAYGIHGWTLNLCADPRDVRRDMSMMHSDAMSTPPVLVEMIYNEIRRGNHYDAIIMDPPSYGRGPKGEIWKIEDAIHPLIKLCTQILSDDPLFFLINSYTTGLAPAVLTYMLATELKKYNGYVDSQEIGLPVTSNGLVLPCGASGRWWVE